MPQSKTRSRIVSGSQSWLTVPSQRERVHGGPTQPSSSTQVVPLTHLVRVRTPTVQSSISVSLTQLRPLVVHVPTPQEAVMATALGGTQRRPSRAQSSRASIAPPPTSRRMQFTATSPSHRVGSQLATSVTALPVHEVTSSQLV